MTSSNIKVDSLVRVFQYNGLELADVDPTASPARVKDVYAAMYPELSTAEVEGPETKNGRLIYKFKRSAGTKGAQTGQSVTVTGGTKVPFAERLAAIAAGQPDPWADKGALWVCQGNKMEQLTSTFRSALTRPGTPIQVPSSAIALML